MKGWFPCERVCPFANSCKPSRRSSVQRWQGWKVRNRGSHGRYACPRPHRPRVGRRCAGRPRSASLPLEPRRSGACRWAPSRRIGSGSSARPSSLGAADRPANGHRACPLDRARLGPGRRHRARPPRVPRADECDAGIDRQQRREVGKPARVAPFESRSERRHPTRIDLRGDRARARAGRPPSSIGRAVGGSCRSFSPSSPARRSWRR